MIRKVGNQWCLFTKDGSKKLGCHDTRQEAVEQEKAVQAQKNASARLAKAYPGGMPLDIVRQICPECAERMAKAGADRVDFRAGQQSEAWYAAMCSKFPGSGGFSFTACTESMADKMSDVDAFCAWLEHECTGFWPAENREESANVLSLEEVEALCAPCAEKMRSAGIRTLKMEGLKEHSPKVYEALMRIGDSRLFRGAASSEGVRTETFNGKECLVVPVVALVEGVIQASNAATPEFVSADNFARSFQGWDGRPVVYDHPEDEGGKTSANSPKTLEERSFGQVFNTRVEGGKLLMDAYLDPERAEQVGAGDIIGRIQEGDVVDVSVGAFVVAQPKMGSYKAKNYKAVWTEITPDHLAFLPKGIPGACDISMGCGAPRAAGGPGSGWHREQGHVPQKGGEDSEGGEARSGFVKAQESFISDGLSSPGSTTTLEGEHSAFEFSKTDKGVEVSQWGKRGDPNYQKDLGVAKNVKDALGKVYDSLSAGGKTKVTPGPYGTFKTRKASRSGEPVSKLKRVLAAIRSALGPSDRDVSTTLGDELRKTLPKGTGVYVDSVFPEDSVLIYYTYAQASPVGDTQYFRCTYTLDESGNASFGPPEEVRPKTVFEPVEVIKEGITPTGDVNPALQTEGEGMTRVERLKAMASKAQKKAEAVPLVDRLLSEDVLKALEQLPDDLLKALEALPPEGLAALGTLLSAVSGSPAAQPAEGIPPETAASAQTSKTEDELLADMPQAIQQIVAEAKAMKAAKRAELLAAAEASKQSVFTKEELEAMELPQLEKTIRLAQGSLPVDQSGRAAPRATSSQEESAPKAPSLKDAIRAARKGA